MAAMSRSKAASKILMIQQESERYLIACIYTLEMRNFGLDLPDFTRAVEEM